MSILQAKEIEVSYGDNFTLGPLSLDLKEGNHIALLGPSGSGKSTLLRALTGQIEPTQGHLMALGKKRRVSQQLLAGFEHIYFVQQTLALPHFQYIKASFHRALAHLPEPAQEDEIRKYAHLFEVDPFLNQKPEALSLGQQQRCALALAFCNTPKIVALDEPFSHQDAWQRQRMLEAVRQASQIANTTLLVCTHALDEATYLCKDAIYLLQGKCVYQGSLKNLSSIEQPEVQALFGWVSPLLHGWAHLTRVPRRVKNCQVFTVEACVPHVNAWLLIGTLAEGQKGWAISSTKARQGQEVYVQPSAKN